MNYYTKIKDNSEILNLEGVKLKGEFSTKFSLFFKSTNHSRNNLLKTGRSVLFLQGGLIDSGNLDCIPKHWKELGYDDFVKLISSNVMGEFR
ncbi:hypothetical protein EGM51_09800 [Verrucomicrobia bacterium S94]|nr:hypothetical protein EGM51_09800 [Verrucomicrobia bacterium S94]